MPRKPSPPHEGGHLASNPTPSTLWHAIEAVSLARGHRPSDVARFVGLHAAHYYRIRKHPQQIARCRSEVLARFSEYVEWTVLDVYLGSGLIDPSDLWAAPTSAEVLREALVKVARGRFASGLTTPLDDAALDHQLLIARLHVAVLTEAMGKT